MNRPLFDEFLTSGDTLRVYKETKLIFSSDKDRLLPLLEYIDRFAPGHQRVTVLDRVMGNAAALLSIKAGCQEVCSPLGSQLAVNTLDKHGIKYHLTSIVPYIRQPHRDEICPMEKLSIDKGPEEFYEAMRTVIGRPLQGYYTYFGSVEDMKNRGLDLETLHIPPLCVKKRKILAQPVNFSLVRLAVDSRASRPLDKVYYCTP